MAADYRRLTPAQPRGTAISLPRYSSYYAHGALLHRNVTVPLAGLPEHCMVHADKAYDTNRVRDLIESQDAVPNIPPNRTRLWKSCFSKSLYRGRNAIERMFCRLKDCRRIATRYDRLAANFLGSLISPPQSCGGCESQPSARISGPDI